MLQMNVSATGTSHNSDESVSAAKWCVPGSRSGHPVATSAAPMPAKNMPRAFRLRGLETIKQHSAINSNATSVAEPRCDNDSDSKWALSPAASAEESTLKRRTRR